MDIEDMLAVILAGILLMAGHPESRAAELTQEQATMIYALAHSTSGYRLPERPPTIYLVPQEKLREMACPGRACNVRGFSIGLDIYLDEELDMSTVYGASILYHEALHFLQAVNLGPAKNCEEWVDREIEAYQWQNYVLEKAGAQPVLVPAFNCL